MKDTARQRRGGDKEGDENEDKDGVRETEKRGKWPGQPTGAKGKGKRSRRPRDGILPLQNSNVISDQAKRAGPLLCPAELCAKPLSALYHQRARLSLTRHPSEASLIAMAPYS